MTTTSATDSRIKCEHCGAMIHAVRVHLKECHEGSATDDHPKTEADYAAQYPGAPLMSALAEAKLKEARARKEREAAASKVSADGAAPIVARKVAMNELFALGNAKEAMNANGGPIPISVVENDEESQKLVPELDPNYVFNIDVLKSMLMGVEMLIPSYLWGHSGTGKTTMWEQICARTNRALFRVQHTANMEEEHVVGGWRLRDGHTHFELGPLPLAMKMGWVYLADEYDFARPEVTALYQAVLEGKPLVIKEADAANRVIKPHPNFRIVATGNTNGQGDETGLYQGTTMGNAANFERFGIVEQMPYMNAKLEAALVSAQAGIPVKDAEKLVDYAGRIRTEYDAGQIGNPISPRALINAGRIGMVRRSYRVGLEKAFINRLTAVDRKAAAEVAQRVFGS